MSLCADNNAKEATSRQILKHIRKIETPMHDVRDLMVNIVQQYQQVDKVGYALGLFDKSASFIDSMSWCSIVGKMDHHKDTLNKNNKEHLTKLVSYLSDLTETFEENVVEKIQHYRDIWMKKVLLWDVAIIAILAAIMTLMFYSLNFSLDKNTIYNTLLSRPFFYSIIVVSVVFAFIVLHTLIRNKVAKKMLDDMNDNLPQGMSLTKSFSNNIKLKYSIFRPTPVGWNFWQQKRIHAVSSNLENLHDKLNTVLISYKDE